MANPVHPLETVLKFRYVYKNEYKCNTEAVAQFNDSSLYELDLDCTPLGVESFKVLPGLQPFAFHAAHGIPKFQCLLEYVGQVRDGGILNYFSVPLSNGFFIDASNIGNVSRFMCYSCEPNCFLNEVCVDGELRIFIHTLRLVKKDEALTFSFNYSYKEAEHQLKCNCGSRKCTGRIGGPIGDAEFVCDICDKSFNRKGNFLEHLNVHDSDRPVHQCQECDRSYLDQRGLKRHMKIRHSSSPTSFICSHCGKSYMRKDTLDAHKKRSKHTESSGM